MSRALFVAAVVAWAVAGCSKGKEDPVATQPPPEAVEKIPALEIERGRDACKSYVERLCACAEADPALTGDCDLAKSRPEALELAVKVANSEGGMPKKERWASLMNARKIMAACIEDDLKLTCDKQ